MKKRIQDMDVRNKRVLLRCDFNVPVKDGQILDDSKIVASLNTIDYLVKEGAKIIIMSHFGKVKTEEDKANNSLAPIAAHLQRLVNTKVIFSKQPRSLYLEAKIANMNAYITAVPRDFFKCTKKEVFPFLINTLYDIISDTIGSIKNIIKPRLILD